MSVCAKFEGCASKTVGAVGFLRVTGFSKNYYCQISAGINKNSPHGCQFNGTDFKLGKQV